MADIKEASGRITSYRQSEWRLQMLSQVRDEKAEKAQFDAAFIGALSVHVPDEVWNACLKTASIVAG